MLAKPGATKRPIAGLLTGTSLHRIVFNVSNRIPIVLFIPDKAVKVIFHPELTTAVKILIRFVRCITLMRVDDVFDVLILEAP
jgi:hypothetical protein